MLTATYTTSLIILQYYLIMSYDDSSKRGQLHLLIIR